MKIRLTRLFLFVSLLLSSLVLKAQPALLTVLPDNAGNFITSNGVLYFTIGDSLWKSNGTSSGTVFVKEIGEPIQELTDITVGTFFYFLTHEAGGNTALWKSNGTAVNTFKIASYPAILPLLNFKNALILGIDDGIHGFELWRITAANVRTMISDINPGAGSGLIGEVTIYNDLLYFKANSGTGPNIWKSNATSITTLAIDVPFDNFYALTVANNYLYFVSYYTESDYTYVELWRTNGTLAGSEIIFSAAGEDFCNNTITNLISYNNKLYFDFIEGCGIAIDQLYSTDGTYAGTSFIKTLNLDGYISEFMKVNNRLVYHGSSQGFPGSLWRSNGTSAGTENFYDMQSEPTGEFERVGNLLFFADHVNAYYGEPDTYEDYFQLFQSGLHTENTEPVKNIFGGSYAGAANLRNANGKLFFTTYNHHFAAPLSDKVLRLFYYDPTVVFRSTQLASSTSIEMRAFPNPSSESFTFTINPQSDDIATAEIYDARGMLIATLFEETVTVGNELQFSWNASEAPEGMYICKYKCGEDYQVKQIIKIK